MSLFFSLTFLGGNKLELIARLAKRLEKQKTTTIERLEEKVNAYFQERGPDEKESNHHQISNLYAKYFNAVDSFNKYALNPFDCHLIHSYYYRDPYPHKYSTWQACVIFELLYCGVINCWTAYCSGRPNDPPQLEDFLKFYWENLRDIEQLP